MATNVSGAMAHAGTAPQVGPLLREWRERRRLSQLELALEAGVSARHVSFVETGRANPSPEMVLRLAGKLDVPLRESNRLLIAAGYAPRYGALAFEAPEMDPVREAIDRVLSAHDPYPAVVVDRHWELIAANRGAGLLTDGAAPELREPPVNALRLTLHPDVWTWLCLAAAAPLLAAFVLWQRRLAGRGGAPLLSPGLFAQRAFTAGLAVSIVFYAGMASFFLVLAVYLQEGRGQDALASGLTFTPLAAGYLAASIVAPRLGRRALGLGGLVRAAGLAGLAVAVDRGAPTGVLVPLLLVDGVGIGLLTAPLVATVLGGLEPRDAGAATGVLSTAQQVGNTVGAAIVGALFHGALGGGDYSHAFTVAVLAILGACLAVSALVPPLPARRATSVPAAEAATA